MKKIALIIITLMLGFMTFGQLDTNKINSNYKEFEINLVESNMKIKQDSVFNDIRLIKYQMNLSGNYLIKSHQNWSMSILTGIIGSGFIALGAINERPDICTFGGLFLTVSVALNISSRIKIKKAGQALKNIKVKI